MKGDNTQTIFIRALWELSNIQGTKLNKIPGLQEMMKDVILEMKTALTTNDYALVMGVGENMTCYVMEYDVRVNHSIDALKLVYWYGHGVMELFTGIKRDIAKIALLLMMDSMVRDYTKGQGIDPQIYSKLAHTLLQERTKDNLGRYGLYMVFKNSALMCVDDCFCGQKRIAELNTES